MEPRYRAGEIVFVNPTRPPRRGDDVVIQVEVDGELSGYIKEFIQESDDKLVVSQFNPDKKITFRRETVRSVHVIEMASR